MQRLPARQIFGLSSYGVGAGAANDRFLDVTLFLWGRDFARRCPGGAAARAAPRSIPG